MQKHVTCQAGLIGFPLGHSLSPALQNAAFAHHGLDCEYVLWETPAEDVERRVSSLRRPDVLGANVTVPHKALVMALLDRVSPEATEIGAVNTIVNHAGRLEGFNTDVAGFLRALRADAEHEPRGTSALVLGAGGAARAVVYGLVRAGAASVQVANRGRERARLLVEQFQASATSTRLAVVDWERSSLEKALAACDLVVNTSSAGMWHGGAEQVDPLLGAALPSRVTVFDLVYNPPLTVLLRRSQAAGARAVGGLGMLVYQGAESFQLWTGREAPVEKMLAAARAALKTWGEGND